MRHNICLPWRPASRPRRDAGGPLPGQGRRFSGFRRGQRPCWDSYAGVRADRKKTDFCAGPAQGQLCLRRTRLAWARQTLVWEKSTALLHALPSKKMLAGTGYLMVRYSLLHSCPYNKIDHVTYLHARTFNLIPYWPTADTDDRKAKRNARADSSGGTSGKRTREFIL